MDTDMLIRHCPDEVFLRKAPSAVRRHPTGKYLDHQEMHEKTLFRDGSQIGGINAGFVLLKPSPRDVKRSFKWTRSSIATAPVEIWKEI